MSCCCSFWNWCYFQVAIAVAAVIYWFITIVGWVIDCVINVVGWVVAVKLVVAIVWSAATVWVVIAAYIFAAVTNNDGAVGRYLAGKAAAFLYLK